MAKLVLLVVAAAWAAVLIPPMLRSRVDNRPNSSVTDFRRQLNRLQSSATPHRGGARSLGRPLAQSPLQRQAAAGRPGHPAPARQAATRTGGTVVRDRTGDMPRMRTHGDPTGGNRRPEQNRPEQNRSDESRGHRRADHINPAETRGHRRPEQGERHRQQTARRPAEAQARPAQRTHDRTGGIRRPEADRRLLDPAAVAKRRRTNVLFILVVTSACTMFLAATTDSVVMLWAFGLSFVATCGYLYVLAQLREHEQTSGWLEHR